MYLWPTDLCWNWVLTSRMALIPQVSI